MLTKREKDKRKSRTGRLKTLKNTLLVVADMH
jgi:hypothetical protein